MSDDDGETRAPHASPFEAIREGAEDGSEYWSARNLSKILGYTEWRNFTTAIEKAKEACENSGQETIEEFGGTLPEDLPTPKESIQQLERKEQKQIQDRSQPSLFAEPKDADQTND